MDFRILTRGSAAHQQVLDASHYCTMIDLHNVSVVTMVQVDSADRVRNLQLFLQYFETFFVNYEIIVVEQDSESRLRQLLSEHAGVYHHFIETKNCHNRAWNINLGAKLADRKYLYIVDVDCFIKPDAVPLAIEKLEAGAKFVLPYNGIAVQIREALINRIETKLNDVKEKNSSNAAQDKIGFRELVEQLPFFPKLYEIRPPKHDPADYEVIYGTALSDTAGGALICDRREFFMAGGMNENMISYGCEESDFYHRLQKFGYEVVRLPQVNIFHFEHVRTNGSSKNNFFESNRNELQRTKSMSAAELRRYVNNGFRVLELNTDQDVIFTNTAHEYSIRLVAHNRMQRRDVFTVIAFDTAHPDDADALSKLFDQIDSRFDNYAICILEGTTRLLRGCLTRKYAQHSWAQRSLKSLSDDELKQLVHTDRPIVEIFRVEERLDIEHILKHFGSELRAQPQNLQRSAQTEIANGVS